MKTRKQTYLPFDILSVFEWIGSKAAVLSLAVILCIGLTYHERADAQIEVVSPQDGLVSALHSQGITVKGLAGFTAELYVNGKLSKKQTIRIDGIADFINIDVPEGDVTFEIRLLNADGVAIQTVNRKIHILGPPASLVIELEKDQLEADGVSSTKVVVKAFDRWNYQWESGVLVTVVADSGKIVTENADSSKQGAQVQLVNGVAEFTYTAGKCAGVAVIGARVGSASATKELDMNTHTEKFTLVGLASGTGMSTQEGGNRSMLSTSQSFPDGLSTDGRLAVYARGTVLHDYLLTTSFDSDRKNLSRMYRDLDPDYLYSIYGDNSMLSYDVQTTRQFFLKLEHNQSYLYYGDFNTNMTKQEFTLYNRTFNGMKFNLQDKKWTVSGFGTVTDRKVVQVEIRGTGLSGLYQLDHTFITPGSEKIRIETRDRFHSEVVLSRADRYRFSDYEIDYDQGTIFFKQPVSAVDQVGNPTYIVVSFETNNNADKSYVAGGRVERTFANGLAVGVNGVIEQQDPTNYTLLGADAKYALGNTLSVNGEFAGSNSLSSSGLAYKIETGVSPLAAMSVKAYYRQVDKGFTNTTQSGSGREVGTTKYGVGGTYELPAATKLSADYYRSKQDQASTDVTVNSISGGIEHNFTSQLSSALRLEDITYEGTSPDTTQGIVSTHSTLGTAKLNYSINQQFSLSALHERNLGTDVDATKPNATSIIGEYKISDRVAIQGQEKLLDNGGGLSSVGVNTTPLDGTSLYGKYEIGNAIGQHRNMLSIGLKNTLKLPWDLTANLGYERATALEHQLGETPTDDHFAYFGGLEYLPERQPVKLTGKVEYGEDRTRKRTNITFGGDYRFRKDLSLITKYTYSDEQALGASGYETRNDLITGLAYRPVDVNWLNVIGKYEFKSDDNHYLNPFIDDGASIISIHAYIEPVKRVELGTKFAYKTSTQNSLDFSMTTHTSFYLLSGRYDLSDRVDVGAEYRILLQSEAGDLLNGYSAEVGYVVMNNLRVAAGYNFKGYKDQDLVDYQLWSKGPFLRMNLKFGEDLFGL